MTPPEASISSISKRLIALVAVVACVPDLAAASPALVSADIRMVVTSATTCEVTMALRVDGVTEVEHRIESFHDAVVELDDVRGARAIAGPLAIGRTRSVVLRLERESYELRYRATQGAGRRDRCPLWVPAIASTGQLGAITVAVRLPDDALPGATMPALTWSGRLGTAALAHVPAFVRVPYTAPGLSPAWDLGRVMDGLAALFLVGASAIWLWQRMSNR